MIDRSRSSVITATAPPIRFREDSSHSRGLDAGPKRVGSAGRPCWVRARRIGLTALFAPRYTSPSRRRKVPACVAPNRRSRWVNSRRSDIGMRKLILFCKKMSRSVFLWSLVVILVAIHIGTYFVSVHGHALYRDRMLYFHAHEGTLFVGSLYSGAINSLLIESGAKRGVLSASYDSPFVIEGLGKTEMRLKEPSFGAVKSVVWPGLAIPMLLLQVFPAMFLALSFCVDRRKKQNKTAMDKPNPVAS